MIETLLQGLIDNLNYWTITILMAIESSFIPFPSEVVIPPAAWKAAQGSDLNIFLVILFATIGACIGALINYFLALWLGRPIVYRFANSKFGRMCLLNQEKVVHAEEYFEKNGVVSTLVGRLIPAVRQLISIPAGLARMPLGTFLLYTAIGAGIWNSVLALIGYLLAQVPGMQEDDLIPTVKEYSHIIGGCIVLIVVVALLVLFFRKKRKSRKQKIG